MSNAKNPFESSPDVFGTLQALPRKAAQALRREMPMAAPVASAPPALKPTAPPVVSAPPDVYIESSRANPPLARFELILRSGRYWSYPYAHVALIDCPSQEVVVLHCTCGQIKTIELRGWGLLKIAELLGSQRLQRIYETNNPEFNQKEIVIEEVLAKPVKAPLMQRQENHL